MAWVDGKPKVMSYRLKLMGAKHDSEAIYNIIIAALTEDGIHDKVKQHLVAYVADGTSVNLGEYQSVFTRLKRWTGRNILKVWCKGHR